MNSVTLIPLSNGCVRSWRIADAPSLARHANDRDIWLNLRDAFPHPYTEADGRAYIERARSSRPETLLCIEVDGQAAGGIGYGIHQDVERFSAEIGYWLGRRFWGRGIVTEALRAVTAHAFRVHGLHRLFALPYAGNAASCRVLEKAGYRLEGRLREHSFKDGRFVDQLLYAIVVGEVLPARAPGEPA